MQGIKDRQVTLGLRPSSFVTQGAQHPQIALRVVVSEYLGAQSVLVTRCGGTDVLVETQNAAPAKAGTTQSFGVLVDEMVIFDKTSGLRL